MRKDVALIKKRIAELNVEIKKIEQEKIIKAGKLTLSIFSKEADFTVENLSILKTKLSRLLMMEDK